VVSVLCVVTYLIFLSSRNQNTNGANIANLEMAVVPFIIRTGQKSALHIAAYGSLVGLPTNGFL
jgi:hypothetical protein